MTGKKRERCLQKWHKSHVSITCEYSTPYCYYSHRTYASPNIFPVIKSRRMLWEGHVAGMGEMRNAYSILVGKPDGKRPLGKTRRRW